MDQIIVSLMNGVIYGLLLFMVSAGLTLIFGMMGVLNFAHASFYMLGAYFAYTLQGADRLLARAGGLAGAGGAGGRGGRALLPAARAPPRACA
jgi:branched-subunit amino acid ABC-type transport system permease component